MTAPAPSPPVIDPSVAADHLLDAMNSLLAIRNSTLDGTPLRAAILSALAGVDSALRLIRAMKGTEA